MKKRLSLQNPKSFTNPEYGCAPEERNFRLYFMVLINLDKPSDSTFHEIDS